MQQGQAKPELMEQGWRAFLVKVHNQAGVTAVLAVDSPNAGPLPNQPANARAMRVDGSADVQQAADEGAPLRASNWNTAFCRSMRKTPASAKPSSTFDVGQGSQDLGFRSEVDILFTIAPSAKVTFRVLDSNDKPTTGSFLIRDERQRVYPSQTKRLAPDFFFQPQVYRADGESVALPPGKYTIEYSRGPEYRKRTQTLDDHRHRAADAHVPAGTLDRPGEDGLVLRRSSHPRGRVRAL